MIAWRVDLHLPPQLLERPGCGAADHERHRPWIGLGRVHHEARRVVEVDDVDRAAVMAERRRREQSLLMRPERSRRAGRSNSSMTDRPGFRQIVDLYNAFSLLIMNRVLNSDPNWSAWDQETEEQQYDRTVANADAVRLTYDVRKRWTLTEAAAARGESPQGA